MVSPSSGVSGSGLAERALCRRWTVQDIGPQMWWTYDRPILNFWLAARPSARVRESHATAPATAHDVERLIAHVTPAVWDQLIYGAASGAQARVALDVQAEGGPLDRPRLASVCTPEQRRAWPRNGRDRAHRGRPNGSDRPAGGEVMTAIAPVAEPRPGGQVRISWCRHQWVTSPRRPGGAGGGVAPSARQTAEGGPSHDPTRVRGRFIGPRRAEDRRPTAGADSASDPWHRTRRHDGTASAGPQIDRTWPYERNDAEL